METDYEALARRMLRPERPRLAEARAAVAGITDARAAWEILATRGIIPSGWVDDPQRRFWRADYGDLGPCPATVAACAAFAGDVDGVTTAERLAAVLTTRLAPFGLDAPHATAWATVPRGSVAAWAEPPDDALFHAWEAATAAVRPLGTPPPAPAAAIYAASGYEGALLADPHTGVRGPYDWFATRLVEAAAGAAYWELARRADLPVPRGTAAHGRRFAELANPFEAVIALLGTGYAVSVVASDGLDLAAPEVGDDE